MASHLLSDSSSHPPLDSPHETSLPSQITFWYRVLDWPKDDAERITLDTTSDVSGLRKAIAPNVLDPFCPEKTIHVTNIEIWQVCGCGARRVGQILIDLTQLNFAHVHEAADDTKWENILTNYGTKVSAFATLLHNTAQIAEILPRRKADKPLLNLIIVRKRQRERVFESDEEKEDQDKLTALNVYSKRELLSSPIYARPRLHAVRICLPARQYEIPQRKNSFCRCGICKFPRITSEGAPDI